MSDIRKTLQQLDEMTAGATGAGSIAPSMGGGNGFANGGPGTKKRLEEVDLEELNVGKPTKKTEWMKTEKEKKQSPSLGTPSGWGMWSNSPSKTAKQTKVKSMKVVESKKKIDEADLEEEKLEPKNKKSKIDMVGKKKPDQRDISKKPKDKDILPKSLNESADEAEALFNKVRSITSGIKHGVEPRDIMTQVQILANDAGIDISTEIGDVYEAMKALESAVYGLDEPFEYAAQQARWKEEEDELDESPDGVNPSTKMVLENKPETEREWLARMKQEHGAVKVTKDKRTGILHATVKGREVGKYDGNQMDMFGESKKGKK
jgi:hypothetical protein